MGSYNRDDRGGFQSRGRSSFGGRGFDRNDRAPREMFKAICDNCGKECEVPFKPTSGKPVYCSDCFEKMGGHDSRDSQQRSERPSFRTPAAPTQDMSQINAKLDKILSLLETKETQTSLVEVIETPKTPKVKKAASKK